MNPMTNEDFLRIFLSSIELKAPADRVRQHPSHPKYQQPLIDPWTKLLSDQKPEGIDRASDLLKKQKNNNDYLEIFEE